MHVENDRLKKTRSIPVRDDTRRRRICLFAWLLVFSTSVSAAPPVLNSNNERLLQVTLLSDGTVLSQSLLAYQWGTDWYLPLVEMSQSLGISLQADSSNVISGFILEERNPFKLDFDACAVRFGTKSEDKTFCDQITRVGDEVFISAKLFQKWFPVDLIIQTFNSEIKVKSRSPLPLELKRKRESTALETSAGTRRRTDSIEAPKGFKPFEGPFIDQHVEATKESSGGEHTISTGLETTATAQVLNLDALANIVTKDKEITRHLINLSRSDPDGNLLGVLRATQISMIDVQFPASHLITSGGLKKGFTATNFDLDATGTFSETSFTGLLKEGWDVELYHNDILIRRITSSENPTPGRYEFRNVPLYYGRNIFRITQYGPFGEQNNEYKTVNIGQDQARAKKLRYRLATGWVEKTPVFHLQWDQGITDWLTSSATVVKTERKDVKTGLTEYQNYGLAEARFTLPNFVAGLSGAYQQKTGGNIVEISARLPIQTLSFGLKHALLRNYFSQEFEESPNDPLKEVTSAETNFNISLLNGIGNFLSLSRYKYTLKSRDRLRHRLYTNLWSAFFLNDLRYEFNNPFPIDGESSLSWFWNPISARYGISYNSLGFTTQDFEIQIPFEPRWNLKLSAKRQFAARSNQYGGALTKDLSLFSIGFRGTLDPPSASQTSTQYTVAAFLDTSIIPDVGRPALNVSSTTSAPLGAASIRVFKDLNRNSTWDPGEPPIKGADLGIDTRPEEYKTDEAGYVFIPRLTPYVPVDLSVSLIPIGDPSLKSSVSAYRFLPRPGKIQNIEFGVVSVGAVDGMLLLENLPARRVEMQLQEILSDGAKGRALVTKTDSEGIFFFEDVPPGSYRLKLSDHVLNQKYFSTPEEYAVTIDPAGGFVSGKDFVLKRK